MATLKTNYKDDMFSGDRKYREIRNSDGTVSFEDVTEYTQTGDVFASADINATNTEVNGINASLTDNGAAFKFGYDTTSGKYGYYETVGGADTFHPFSGGVEPDYYDYQITTTTLTHNLSNLTVGQQVLLAVSGHNFFTTSNFATTVTGGDIIFEYHNEYPASGYAMVSKLVVIEATATSMTISTNYNSTANGQSEVVVLKDASPKFSANPVNSFSIVQRGTLVFVNNDAYTFDMINGKSKTGIETAISTNCSFVSSVVSAGSYTATITFSKAGQYIYGGTTHFAYDDWQNVSVGDTLTITTWGGGQGETSFVYFKET